MPSPVSMRLKASVEEAADGVVAPEEIITL